MTVPVLFLGCSPPEKRDPLSVNFLEENPELADFSTALTKGSTGAVNGAGDYCDDPAFTCDSGEGDCDTNSECTPGQGLVCVTDIGPQFGFSSACDVCLPAHCDNDTIDEDETGEDCGGADCGICVNCPPGGVPLGHEDFCASDCRCSVGQGDCDSDIDCQTGAGLICGTDNGPKFGFATGIDVCVPPHCTNGVQDRSDGEDWVDCGGPCGSCYFASGTPTSCSTADDNCGPDDNENCCANPQVPALTFYRNYDGNTFNSTSNREATISSFYLDRFQVTVGRFREFHTVFTSWRNAGNPVAGAGAHPSITGSGWNADWPLPTSANGLGVSCDPYFNRWSGSPGTHENEPINCPNWYEAFAFCIWDGGRLPTEAELNAAASGGNEHREYPWGSTTPIPGTHASYSCNGPTCYGNDIRDVGDFPIGESRWNHMDLSGNLWDWTLDIHGTLPFPCTNCANVTAGTGAGGGQRRVLRGGSWASFTTTTLLSGYRGYADVDSHIRTVGWRCARD